MKKEIYITNKGITTKFIHEFDNNKITLRQLSFLAQTGNEIYIDSGKAKLLICEVIQK